MGINAFFNPGDRVPQADWRMVLATRQDPGAWVQNLSQGVNLGAGLADLYRQNQFRQAMQDMTQNGEMDTSSLIKALAAYGDPKYMASLAPEMWKERTQQQAIDLARNWPGGGVSADGSGPSGNTEGLAILGGLNPALSGLGTVAQMRNARDIENYKMGNELIKYYDPATGTMRQAPRNQVPGLGGGASMMQPQQQLPAPPKEGQPQSSLTPGNLPDIGKYQNNPFFSDALAIARTYGIDPKIFMAMIQKESGWDPSAKSPKGAMGLMQLMPATAQRFGVADPFNPIQNMTGAAKYMRFLLDRFGGNYTQALAAYNAGEGAVDKYGGVPPYEETRNYVKSVLTGSRQQPVVMTDTGRQVYPRPGAGTASVDGQTAITMPLTVAQPGPGVQLEPSIEEKNRMEIETALEKKRNEFLLDQRAENFKSQRQRQNAYPIAEDEARAKKNVELSSNWQKDSDNSTDALIFIQDAKNLVREGVTNPGKLATLKGLIGEWLYSSGLVDTSNPFVRQAANNRKFGSIVNQLTLNMLGGRLGAQISNSDRDFIKSALAQIGDNPQAAMEILERFEKMFGRAQERNNAWLAAKSQNPDLRETDFEQQWQAHLRDVWKQEEKDRRSASSSKIQFDMPQSFDNSGKTVQSELGNPAGEKRTTIQELTQIARGNNIPLKKAIDRARQKGWVIYGVQSDGR